MRPTPAMRPTSALRPTPTPKPIPDPCTKPKKPTRSPPPPPQKLRPYQLKPKGGKETFIEPPMEQTSPTSNQKQIKCMKKKIGKLNKKIRHSKKKHNGLISK